MRLPSFVFLFFCFLICTNLYSQDLPSATSAVKTKVKKVIVLRCNDTLSCDTDCVLLFDGEWKSSNCFLNNILADTVAPKNSGDRKGKIFFEGEKTKNALCHDSVGKAYAYDSYGKLIQITYFNPEKGLKHDVFHYDPNGRITAVTCEPYGDFLYTRMEIFYNASGNKDSVIYWWTLNPLNEKRSSQDTKVCSMIYRYDNNGLIHDIIIDNPLDSPFYEPGYYRNGEIFIPKKTILHYIYQ